MFVLMQVYIRLSIFVLYHNDNSVNIMYLFLPPFLFLARFHFTPLDRLSSFSYTHIRPVPMMPRKRPSKFSFRRGAHVRKYVRTRMLIYHYSTRKNFSFYLFSQMFL